MKSLNQVTVIFFVFAISGCVSGKMKIDQPDAHTIDNSRSFPMSKDKLWELLIPAIGKSFYSISTVDKSSGLISLSYTANPEKYLDCGELNSEVKNMRGARTYQVNLAADESNYEVLEKNDALLQVHRTQALEGKINVIVESTSSKSSRMTVNVRYVVTRTARFIGGVDMNLNVMQRGGTDTITFETNGGSNFPRSEIRCVANGQLERELLSLIK